MLGLATGVLKVVVPLQLSKVHRHGLDPEQSPRLTPELVSVAYRWDDSRLVPNYGSFGGDDAKVAQNFGSNATSSAQHSPPSVENFSMTKPSRSNKSSFRPEHIKRIKSVVTW